MNHRRGLFIAAACAALLGGCAGGGGGSSSVPHVNPTAAPASSSTAGPSASPSSTAAPSATATATPAPTATPTTSPSPTPAPTGPAAASSITIHAFDPALTDPNITTDRFFSRSYAPSTNDNGTLLVFLPGQGAHPGAYVTISTFAAQLGYHVVSIDYPSANAPPTFCGVDTTSGCTFNVYMQKWDGRSGPDQITPSNSIQNRLNKLLPYLGAQYPSEGWSRFFSGGSLTWSNTTLAGHSLGSAEVTAIAKIAQVKRVVLLAGPEDGITFPNGSVTPGAWLSSPGATPLSVHYIILHQQDIFYNQVLANATALGLDAYGRWTPVDGASPPYGGKHELSTNVPAGNPHHAVAFDGDIPLDANGNPVYIPAWTYLFGP